MKTLKNLTAALLMVVSFSAFAADGSQSAKSDMNYALKTYVDAVSLGKIDGLQEILDQDIHFTTTRNKKIINHNRAEMLKTLKANENVKQNCSTEYTIIESTSSLGLVKLTMKYEGFSKVEYLSLANTGQGWKITGVSTSFI